MDKRDLRRAQVRDQSGWRMKLYPNAGEAIGAFRSDVGRVSHGDRGLPDPEVTSDIAARRARGQLRRYCAEHGLNRLGDLTYAGDGQFDPIALRRDIAGFFRGLRAELGKPFPYLWVTEWHKEHGLHVHFAVGQFVPRSLIVRCWPQGFVWIHLIGDVPSGAGTRGEARRAARYLAKYVGKEVGYRRTPGLHRYEVAQGFRPKERLIGTISSDEAIEQATELMGTDPEYVWRSRDLDAWTGPPAVFASWR